MMYITTLIEHMQRRRIEIECELRELEQKAALLAEQERMLYFVEMWQVKDDQPEGSEGIP